MKEMFAYQLKPGMKIIDDAKKHGNGVYTVKTSPMAVDAGSSAVVVVTTHSKMFKKETFSLVMNVIDIVTVK